MVYMKKIAALLLSLAMMALLCSVAQAAQEEHLLVLSGSEATLNGAKVPEYDYVWHADPSADHGVVKDSPAEYFTGVKPSGEDHVYIAHDIRYYPQLDESKFLRVNYDGETEWVYMYEAEGYENFIFSTLPVLRSGFPSQMMHTEKEAYENPVLYITQPGTYRLQGSWKGQVRVDLGEESFTDPVAKVTLILDGVDIECSVAAGLVFAQVYECDNSWEDRQTHSAYVDTSDAGANVIIADGSENNVSGTNIYRILRTKYKNEDSKDAYPAQKKQLKVDGAFYSYMSMNISGEEEGTGVLTVNSDFEGLDSELHMTLAGGNIRVFAGNDGININEDDVSVLTITGGSLVIHAGLGDEGDGIDSNGYVLIAGGEVITSANPAADSGLDSDCGTYIQGGTVIALGSTMDWAEDSGGNQPVMNLSFSKSRSAMDMLEITDLEGNVVFSRIPGFENRTYTGMILSIPELEIGQSYILRIGGENQCWSGSQLGGFGMPGQRPDDMQMNPGQRPGGGQRQMPPDNMQPGEIPEGMTPPEGMDPGNMPEGFEMPDGMDRDWMPEGGPEAGMGWGDRGEMDWSGFSSATCTYEQSFPISDAVNAFASVSDYRHDIVAQEDRKNYQCTACGAVFADQEGNILLEQDSQPNNMLYWIIGAVAAVILGAAVVIILALRKKKK